MTRECIGKGVSWKVRKGLFWEGGQYNGGKMGYPGLGLVERICFGKGESVEWSGGVVLN